MRKKARSYAVFPVVVPVITVHCFAVIRPSFLLGYVPAWENVAVHKAPKALLQFLMLAAYVGQPT